MNGQKMISMALSIERGRLFVIASGAKRSKDRDGCKIEWRPLRENETVVRFGSSRKTSYGHARWVAANMVSSSPTRRKHRRMLV